MNFKCILRFQDRRHRLRSRPMYVLFRYGILTFYTAIIIINNNNNNNNNNVVVIVIVTKIITFIITIMHYYYYLFFIFNVNIIKMDFPPIMCKYLL